MLNKKPAHQNRPIYIPKKKKKILKKLLLILIIALIVVILVVLIINVINLKKTGDLTPQTFGIESGILKEIQMNSALKEEILATQGNINWEDMQFPLQTKEKIQTMTPYFLKCVAKICDPDSACSLMNWEIEGSEMENEDIYSGSVLISSDSNNNNRVVRLFCWGQEEEEEDEVIVFSCGDGLINGSEKCDGINLGGKTCQSQGFESGNLKCTTECTFNFSGCTDCLLEETDEDFCLKYGKNCGMFSGTDICQQIRTTDCGTCVAPEICGGGGVSNVCNEEACVPETNQIFCSRYGKDCGMFSETDNCGQTRTVNCGSCVSPEICGAGVLDNVCDVSACQPDCQGKCGGSDGCGGTCPTTCTNGLICRGPLYQVCSPSNSVEFLGRGLIAIPKEEGGIGVYLGWRLLQWDNPNIGFNIYRATSVNGPFTKINSVPITTSTNYYHPNVQPGTYYYTVRSVNSNNVESSNSNLAKVNVGTTIETKNFATWEIVGGETVLKTVANSNYVAISLQSRAPTDLAYHIWRVMTSDLNGDGIMDFSLLMGNNDNEGVPVYAEALISNPDGTWSSKWRTNTGYDSPGAYVFVISWDLTGDGKAEIITRWGEGGDLAVLDGSTGSLLAVTPWPHYLKYNEHAALSLLEDVNGDGVADPFIVVQSGGYGQRALFTAYRLEGGPSNWNLVEKKRIDIGAIKDQTWVEASETWGDATHPQVGGMGTHGLISFDLNNDGFDEIAPCGSIFYPDWSGYWNVNGFHCDSCFPGEMDPQSPGPELFMACEMIADETWEIYGGVAEAMLVRLREGQNPERLWTYPSYTGVAGKHDGFHKGHCAHISAGGFSGLACIAMELDDTVNIPFEEWSRTRYFETSTGIEITNHYDWPFRGWFLWSIDWIRGDQTGKSLLLLRSSMLDVVGDSREEYFQTWNFGNPVNELLIITNDAVVNTRHVTPLSDRGYRSGVARQGNGYETNTILMKTEQPRFDMIPV